MDEDLKSALPLLVFKVEKLIETCSDGWSIREHSISCDSNRTCIWVTNRNRLHVIHFITFTLQICSLLRRLRQVGNAFGSSSNHFFFWGFSFVCFLSSFDSYKSFVLCIYCNFSCVCVLLEAPPLETIANVWFPVRCGARSTQYVFISCFVVYCLISITIIRCLLALPHFCSNPNPHPNTSSFIFYLLFSSLASWATLHSHTIATRRSFHVIFSLVEEQVNPMPTHLLSTRDRRRWHSKVFRSSLSTERNTKSENTTTLIVRRSLIEWSHIIFIDEHFLRKLNSSLGWSFVCVCVCFLHHFIFRRWQWIQTTFFPLIFEESILLKQVFRRCLGLSPFYHFENVDALSSFVWLWLRFHFSSLVLSLFSRNNNTIDINTA